MSACGASFDEFMEYDFTMGADIVTCPYCGADVPTSLFFEDTAECPECGKKFKKSE
jgi:DNA-directed RNA polymerase subunit RPC12/RpoP